LTTHYRKVLVLYSHAYIILFHYIKDFYIVFEYHQSIAFL
jgi:hypothetical protein